MSDPINRVTSMASGGCPVMTAVSLTKTTAAARQGVNLIGRGATSRDSGVFCEGIGRDKPPPEHTPPSGLS